MSNEAKFTEGPWIADVDGQILADNGMLVTWTTADFEEDEVAANQALITAAPDMYAALETVYDALDSTGHYAEARLCAAVLNKARGES